MMFRFFFFFFLLHFKDAEGEADGGAVIGVCWLSCPLLSFSRLVSPSSPGNVVAVAAPRRLHTLSAASVPFIPVSQLTHSSQ